MQESHTSAPVAVPDLAGAISPAEHGTLLSGHSASALKLYKRGSRESTTAHLRLLWERRRFLARVVAVGVLLSVVVSLLISNRYESATRLMPPDSQSGAGLSMAAPALSGAPAGLGGLAGEMLGLKSTSDLVVGVLTSRTVADRVIQKFNLQKVYGTRRMEDARNALAKHTETSIDHKSQIVTLTVTDKRPHRAAAIAQAYIEETNRVMADVSTSSARRERIFLEGRLQAVSQDLEGAEKAFSQFASRNTAIDIKEQGKAMVDAAAALQGQLSAAQSQLQGLRQIYTDNNVRIRSAQAQVAELENQLQKVGGKGDGTSLDTVETSNALYPSIRKLPLLGVSYEDLYRRTRIEEAVLETLNREYELAKVQEAKEIPTVKVLDAPNIPDKKSYPSRTLIVLFGTALAFSLGTTWVYGNAVWQETDATDPVKVFAQEVYESVTASIPGSSHNGHGMRDSAASLPVLRSGTRYSGDQAELGK